MVSIKTDELSASLRAQSIRPSERKILISRLDGSTQEEDLTEPPNCHGYGRIRHFHTATAYPWPDNPLPVLPAAHRLGLPVDEVSVAQVFQNAGCNWRCWYCFVPFTLLAANESVSGWFTAEDLVGMYRESARPPLIIDCSGGQPDLVPEWVPWMMRALTAEHLDHRTYLWSDDNLSNDYFWRYLTGEQRRQIECYPHYGRVCCFKGYNAESFAFNTRADPGLFDRQFRLFARLLSLDIDLYAYATFTAPSDDHLARDMHDFVDRLQDVHENLPLRLVPLKIEDFGVVRPRIHGVHRRAMIIQEAAVQAWNEEINRRFSQEAQNVPMPSVRMGRAR
jgi:uncharacterized Fe-S cluster-containing radical SAM superfamily protein